ncbi:MAG TPA: inositol monophosphatase [Treponema sp.]|nr:inositol monophosphatase [Treponema sp.]
MMDESSRGFLLGAMERAARAAAAIQLPEFRKRDPGWGDAKDSSDFVSFVDLESEKAIRRILDAALPSAAFFGEETERSLGAGATWVVDPLDGTTNYLSGYDHFAVSIALWEEGCPVLGLVLKPVDGELFTASRGGGAFRNGERLHTATFLEPRGALVGTGTPYRSPGTEDAFFGTTRRVLGACRDIRRTGSAALDLSHLASGFLQGFWEVDLQPYDVAAGLLMLSETGHGYRNFAGDAYDPFRHRTFVAGRPGVFEVLREAVLAEYGPLE